MPDRLPTILSPEEVRDFLECINCLFRAAAGPPTPRGRLLRTIGAAPWRRARLRRLAMRPKTPLSAKVATNVYTRLTGHIGWGARQNGTMQVVVTGRSNPEFAYNFELWAEFL